MDIPLPLPLLIGGAEDDGNRESTWLPVHREKLSLIQRSWVTAGCNAVVAPTFRGNRFRLPRRDGEEDVRGYNRTLVELTRRSAGEQVLVAGGMGPAGQELEPFGDVTFEELVTAYAEQAAALAEAGVDLFLLGEGMTMAEERAAMLAVRQASSRPVVVLARCDEEGRTESGTDVLAALIVMQGMGAAAFGLATGEGAEVLLEQLQRLTPYAAIPLAAVVSEPEQELQDLAEAGVKLFACGGALSGDGPSLLARDLALVDFSRFVPPEHDPDVIPCASEKEARFITPDVDVGETIECTSDLMEEILEAEETCPQGALKIAILEEDDVAIFAENQYAVRDALCLWSDVPELLEQALRVYQGRAFWDGTGDLEPEFLAEMAKKYGLVLL
ncbi:Methionine synthase [uncultured Flavonifractor sp.]|nr:Methionine synthase [uncultured Flavonifractor sp.]